MFSNRSEAGRELGRALQGKVSPDVLVLGIPRGGVIVAAEVARELGAPLDVAVARKIGHPGNPEYAVGAVDARGHLVRGPEPVSEAWFAEEGARERAEAERRERAYRGGPGAPEVRGREVLLVDDGIATGLTIRAVAEGLKAAGAARVVVAVPVAPPRSVRTLAEVVDDVVVLESPEGFDAVGSFYRDFSQTGDAEVLAALGGTGPR